MFTHGGQVDLFSFAGLRGGGGKGGGGGTDPRFLTQTATDPVNGMTFTSNYFTNAMGGKDAATQLNEEIQQRQQQEKAKSDQDKIDAANKAAADETSFTNRRQTAYNDALDAVKRQFQLQGVDPAAYMTTDILPTLQRQFNSIQDLDPNPAAAFPTSLGDTIVGNVTSGRRTQANTALNQLFTPTFTTDLLPDTTATQAITDVINSQFDPLGQQLTNAVKRNTLTPAGYQAALDALAQKKTAATSTVQGLANNILSTDRSGINDIISGARTAAGNLSLADTFNPGAFAGQAQSKAAQDIAGFGGALQSAVGDTKFADIQDLINAGGVVQGATNPTATNPTGIATNLSPFAPDQQAQDAKRRGLGSTGAF